MQIAMKGPLFVLIALRSCFAERGISAITPIQQVVKLLEGMVTTSKAAKHEENVQFAGFKQFCDTVTVQKEKDIKESDGMIELLKADIEKANSEATRLGKEIGGHETDITGWDKDKKDSTKVRDTERATYLEAHRDYTESIEALGQAMIMLKNQNFDRPAVSFLQEMGATLDSTPKEALTAVHAFLETAKGQKDAEPDPEDDLGYKATAYKFQSGAIIEMLEGLKAKFKKELTKLESDEVARRQAYDMLAQNLKDQTTDGEQSIQSKTMTQAKQKQLSIEKAADLTEVTGVRKSDAQYLSDLSSLCEKKTAEFKSRTKLREEEIEALEKAIEIISGDDVDDAKKHLPSLLTYELGKASSFAQLRSSTSSPNQMRAADFLREEAVRLSSNVLSTLAMEARADPFGKVKKLIQELINRLMEEATNEAEHKGWCDKELATNKHTRETKSAEVDELTASIEGLEADIKNLKKTIKKKSEEVAKIEADVAEFTAKRNNETATNAATLKDSKEGQAAIKSAIKVLKDFFAKAAKAKSFAQTTEGQQPEAPEIFDGAYKGQQDAKGGVIGMLEVILSDFERLESDTNSAEQAAQNEYDEFMSDSAQAKASLDVDLKHANTNKFEDR
jgi:hypothetical protein